MAIAARSGDVIATFFGAISPSTMWRYTTIASATANEIEWSTASGTSTNSSIAASSRVATAGSATKPSSSEAIVMPS